LAAIQREDGSLPVSQSLATPGWPTPYALLLWSGLMGFDGARLRARNWLLGCQGRPIPRTDETAKVVGHNSTLIGWPWVDGTHSWLEPTALAILALCREDHGDHPRVRQGIGLILDRAIPRGGWNYGNKSVFGRALRPQPGPTGLALLALAARGEWTSGVPAALDYLRGTLPSLRAAVSLGWGVLGLRAHQACPAEAESWLAEAYEHGWGRPGSVLGLAVLILAAGENALRLLLPPLTGGRKPVVRGQ
jgi:hypothetical protein